MSRLRCLACLGSVALLALARSANGQMNELQLCNGGDGFFIYDDPSLGFPTGTFPPDHAGGNWIWKVFPAAALRVADGALSSHQIEWTGITVTLADTDWTTPPSFYDLIVTTGTSTGLGSGNIGPDFASPFLVFVSMGASSLGNPCSLPGNPFGCTGPCPPPGFIPHWVVELVVSGGPGPHGGFLFPADGATDLVTASFLPGGMTFVAGSPGQCGLGDYTLSDWHSGLVFGGGFGEKQAPTPNGFSPYGGYSFGGSQFAEYVDEVQDQPLQFASSMIEGRTTLDPPANPTLGTTGLGLSSLRAAVGGGTTGYGVKMIASAHVGQFGFVMGSFQPQLPDPGVTLLGMNVLIDLTDPVTSRTSAMWNGTLTPASHGGPPFDNGVVVLPTITMPSYVVGFTLNMQGFFFDPVTFTFDDTGTFQAQML